MTSLRWSLVSRRSENRAMKISVAMATYNGERFIADQLESLAAQWRLPDELVISDDCSTDRTLEIVERFAESAPFPVVVNRNERTLGYGDNFLRAAQLCRGDWISFCDQDDVWLSRKLAVIERYTNVANRDVLLIAHSATVVDERLRKGASRRPNIRRFIVCRGTDLPAFWYVEGLAISFRSDLVRKLSPWDRGPDGGRPHMALAHDVWVCRLARILGDIVLLPDSLCLYRRHSETVTAAYKESASRVGRLRQMMSTVFMAFESGAKEYRSYSVSLKCQAMAFGRLARSQSDSQWRDRLVDAESEFEQFSEWMSMRSRLYCESSLSRRMHLLSALRSDGKYGRLLGWRALAKDAFIAVVGGERFASRESTRV